MALKRRFLSIILTVVFLIFSNYSFVKAEDFILGFYAFPNKHFVDLIAESNLKYLVVYGTDGMKDKKLLEEFLDYANKKEVKIIFSLKDCYKTSKWYPNTNWCDNANEIDLVKCILDKFDNHASIAGYYLADDGTYTIGDKNLNTYLSHVKSIKAMSKKPIFVNELPPPKGKMFDVFSNSSDYLIVGIYPVPDEDIGKVYEVIRTTIERYKKPVIALIQAHGKYQYPFYKRDEITGRPPTFEEIRIMSYLAILAGAKGIIYYSLFDIEKLPDGKERLNFIKNLTKELNFVLKVTQKN